MEQKKPQYEKMSKSRGNVITPDEVMYGVAELQPGYEFRFFNGVVIDDFKELGVWRNRLNDSMFYTSTRTGKHPVFLHEKGNPVPALLLIDGEECLQHPEKHHLWLHILQINGEDISDLIAPKPLDEGIVSQNPE